jgi:hypothetical protein
MLKTNRPDPRKVLVAATARALPPRALAFDVVNIDCVMHHMVDRISYSGTISVLPPVPGLRSFLRPGGLVMIREIYHESFAAADLGARLLFELSTATVPPLAGRLLEKAGMHTANAGVCFLTRSHWRDVLWGAGYAVQGSKVQPWRSLELKACGFRNSGELDYVLAA